MPGSPTRWSATARWPFTGRRAELAVFVAGLRDRSCRGILIHGEAGVGKSRLAEECVAVAAATRHAVGRATATSLAANVPLGAFVHLLPSDIGSGDLDAVTVFGAVAASMRDQAGAKRFVLFVDDLHLLDQTSATLVTQLLDAGVIFLVATVRAGASGGEAMVDLFRDEHMVRLEVGEFSPVELEAVLVAALGGPVLTAMVTGMWSMSRGNALFVREMVCAAKSLGALRREHGVWFLGGRVPIVGRLGEMVELRLGQVGADDRAVVELLAVAAPVDLVEVEERFGLAPIERLERLGLVVVSAGAPGGEVGLAHPMYGEMLRDGMAVTTRRRILLDHIAWIEARAPSQRVDLVRLAAWQLDALGSADPALLVAAARLARFCHDYRHVERLARAALVDSDDNDNEARLLLGEALADLGGFEEAETVLAEAQSAALDDQAFLEVVVTRVRNLVWGLLRPDEAVTVIRSARQHVSSDAACTEMLGDEASALVFSGRPVEALQMLEQLRGADDLRTRVVRSIAESCALVITGRSEQAVDVARDGMHAHFELGDQLAIAHPGTHTLTEVFALAESGRITEAIDVATAGYQVARGERYPIGQIMFTMNLGRCALLAGSPLTAQRWLAESDAACVKYRFAGPRRLVLSAMATAASWNGEPALARHAIDELAELAPFGFLFPEEQLGVAWCAVAEGDPQTARDVLTAAAAAAARTGHRSSEATLLHDLARLGDPSTAAPRLAELAATCQGALVAAYAAHASAAAADDPDGLVEACTRFESIGATLLAAETATAAAHAYQRQGRASTATSLAARADMLAQRCEGAHTPGLVTARAAVPLTSREREIASLAADGVASKQIAERLFVSVRTVNNHLQRAYAKLGVTSRAELGRVLTSTGAERMRD